MSSEVDGLFSCCKALPINGIVRAVTGDQVSVQWFSSGVAKQLHSHNALDLEALYPVEFLDDFVRYFTPILD